jgi:hypothetical protein
MDWRAAYGVRLLLRLILRTSVPKKGTVVDYVRSIVLSFKDEPTRYMTAVCGSRNKRHNAIPMSVAEVKI